MPDIINLITGGRSGSIGQEYTRLLLAEMFPEVFGGKSRASYAGSIAKKILSEYYDRMLNPLSHEAQMRLFRPVKEAILHYTPREHMRAPYYHGASAFGRGTGPSPRLFNQSDPITNTGRMRAMLLRKSRVWTAVVKPGNDIGTIGLSVSFLSMKDLGLPYAESVDRGFVRNYSYTTHMFVSHGKSKRKKIGEGRQPKAKGMPLRSAFTNYKGKRTRQPGTKSDYIRYDFMNLNRLGDGRWRSTRGQYLQGGKAVFGHQMMAAGFDSLAKALDKYSMAVVADCINTKLDSSGRWIKSK